VTPFGRIDTRQPIDWQHPLNRGLLSCWLPFGPWRGGGTLRDLARRNDGTLTNGPTWTAGPNGFGAVQFDGVNDYVDCGTIPGLNGATQAYFSAWIYRATTGTTAGLGGCGGSAAGGDNRFSLIWFTDSRIYFSAAQSGFNGFAFASVTGTGWRHVALVYDGSQASNATRAVLYVDGVSQSVTYNGGVGTALGNVSPFWVGADASNRFTGGSVSDIRLGLVAPSSDAVRSLYDQSQRGYPDLFRRIPSRTWFGVSAGGGGSDIITADGGTYTLTGADATIRAGRVVSAGSGSYTLTGGAANILAGRRVAADSGSFTLTGSPATIAVSRCIVAGAGSYAITGGTATIRVNRRVSAGAGTFTLAGADAALLASRRVAADAGTFTLTGTAATVRASRLISAGSGSYTLTGSPADITTSGDTSTTFPADSGSFVLAGADATVRVGRKLSAGSGSYTVTGSNATIRVTRRIAAGIGTYTLTGTAANITASTDTPTGDSNLYVFIVF
jgi:hypothetical protein